MKHVMCSCGDLVSAETGEELLAAVEAHIATKHRSHDVPETTDAQAEAEPKEER